jgi:hypothetical protein
MLTKIRLRTQIDNEMKDGLDNEFKTLRCAKQTHSALGKETQLSRVGAIALGHHLDSQGMVQYRPVPGITEEVEVSRDAYSLASTIASSGEEATFEYELGLGDYETPFAAHTDASCAISYSLLQALTAKQLDSYGVIFENSAADRAAVVVDIESKSAAHMDRISALEIMSQLGIYWLPPVEDHLELEALQEGTLPNDGLDGTGDLRPAMALGDAVVVKSVDAMVMKVAEGGVDFSDPSFAARLAGSDSDWSDIASKQVAIGRNEELVVIMESSQLGSIRTDSEHKFRTPSAIQAAVWGLYGSLDAPSETYDDMAAEDSGENFEDGSIRDLGHQTKEALVIASARRDADIFSQNLDNSLDLLAVHATDLMKEAMELRHDTAIVNEFLLAPDLDTGEGSFVLPLTDATGAAIPFGRVQEGEHACDLQIFQNGVKLSEVTIAGFELWLGEAAPQTFVGAHGENYQIYILKGENNEAILVCDTSNGQYENGDVIQIHLELSPSFAKLGAVSDKLDEIVMSSYLNDHGAAIVESL